MSPTPQPTPERALTGVRVTFVNNAGFLITVGDKKILIDSLYEGSYQRGGLAAIAQAQPPFDGVDLILATHAHLDHFSPQGVLEHLQNNPEAVFVSTPNAINQLLALDNRVQARVIAVNPPRNKSQALTVNGIALEALYLSHNTPEFNVGFVITVDQVKIFHTGDAEAAVNRVEKLQAYGLPEKNIDIAFVPLEWASTPAYTALISEGIRPRYLFPMHYDVGEALPWSELRAHFPEAILFHDSLESWEMP